MEDAHKALGGRPLSTVWVVKLDRTVDAGSVCGVKSGSGENLCPWWNSMPFSILHLVAWYLHLDQATMEQQEQSICLLSGNGLRVGSNRGIAICNLGTSISMDDSRMPHNSCRLSDHTWACSRSAGTWQDEYFRPKIPSPGIASLDMHKMTEPPYTIKLRDGPSHLGTAASRLARCCQQQQRVWLAISCSTPHKSIGMLTWTTLG